MKKVLYTALVLSPAVLYAQALSTAGQTIKDFILYDVLYVIRDTIPILVASAFIVFFWGLSKFILHSGSASDIQKGRGYMFWGIIALFLLVTFRTIINFIAMDLGLGDGTIAPLLPAGGTGNPQVTTSTSFP